MHPGWKGILLQGGVRYAPVLKINVVQLKHANAVVDFMFQIFKKMFLDGSRETSTGLILSMARFIYHRLDHIARRRLQSYHR